MKTPQHPEDFTAPVDLLKQQREVLIEMKEKARDNAERHKDIVRQHMNEVDQYTRLIHEIENDILKLLPATSTAANVGKK